MEYPEFSGFDWDDGNRNKNLKHTVQNWECEQIFFNEPLVVLNDPKHSLAEDRFAACLERTRVCAGRIAVTLT